MTGILFVDDEPNILESLRDMLRRDRRRWDMTFVDSGERAVEMLAERSFDVVVCDMRMPGMDGAATLRAARSRQPSTSRVVLSGHTERTGMLLSIPLTHRFLAKPCNPGELRQTLESLVSLGELVPERSVRSSVGSITALPARPAAREAALNAIRDPECLPVDVARAAATDPALIANLLRLGNSAFFGNGREAATATAAAAAIGADGLRAQELGAALFDGERPRTSGYPLDLEEFAAHSARVAAAVVVAMPDDEAAFAAGLLHDVGKLILAETEPDVLADLQSEADGRGAPLHVVERERRGITHAEIGALLLGLWGLPARIVEAVAGHAEPTHSSGRLAAAIHAAELQVAGA